MIEEMTKEEKYEQAHKWLNRIQEILREIETDLRMRFPERFDSEE